VRSADGRQAHLEGSLIQYEDLEAGGRLGHAAVVAARRGLQQQQQQQQWRPQ
jgi:hypothetical protein